MQSPNPFSSMSVTFTWRGSISRNTKHNNNIPNCDLQSIQSRVLTWEPSSLKVQHELKLCFWDIQLEMDTFLCREDFDFCRFFCAESMRRKSEDLAIFCERGLKIPKHHISLCLRTCVQFLQRILTHSFAWSNENASRMRRPIRTSKK